MTKRMHNWICHLNEKTLILHISKLLRVLFKMVVCTKCGETVPALFTKLPNGLIKILNCPKCSAIADKYIEFDLTIVMIDVFLIRSEAYRHMLFNSESKIGRTIFLLLVAEAYCKWVLDEHFTSSSANASSDSEKPPFGSKSPLYFRAPGEWRFYYWFLLSSLEVFSCGLFALLLLCFVEKVSVAKMWRTHFEAFVLGNFVKIFSLCVLVWLPTQQSQSYLFIISLLAASSLYISYKVTYPNCRAIFIFLAAVVTFIFPYAVAPIIDDKLRPILFGGDLRS